MLVRGPVKCEIEAQWPEKPPWPSHFICSQHRLSGQERSLISTQFVCLQFRMKNSYLAPIISYMSGEKSLSAAICMLFPTLYMALLMAIVIMSGLNEQGKQPLASIRPVTDSQQYRLPQCLSQKFSFACPKPGFPV